MRMRRASVQHQQPQIAAVGAPLSVYMHESVVCAWRGWRASCVWVRVSSSGMMTYFRLYTKRKSSSPQTRLVQIYSPVNTSATVGSRLPCPSGAPACDATSERTSPTAKSSIALSHVMQLSHHNVTHRLSHQHASHIIRQESQGARMPTYPTAHNLATHTRAKVGFGHFSRSSMARRAGVCCGPRYEVAVGGGWGGEKMLQISKGTHIHTLQSVTSGKSYVLCFGADVRCCLSFITRSSEYGASPD